MIVVPECKEAKSMLDKLSKAHAMPGAIIYLNKAEISCFNKCTFIEVEEKLNENTK